MSVVVAVLVGDDEPTADQRCRCVVHDGLFCHVLHEHHVASHKADSVSQRMGNGQGQVVVGLILTVKVDEKNIQFLRLRLDSLDFLAHGFLSSPSFVRGLYSVTT